MRVKKKIESERVAVCVKTFESERVTMRVKTFENECPD